MLILFFLTFKYRRKDRKVFTIQNISLFSIFVGLTIGLSYFTITIIPNVLSIGFTLIPIMFVGFLLGPLEGFFFGFLVDLILTLVSGWQFLLLYALTKPFAGLIGGIIGEREEGLKNEKNFKYVVAFTQLFILLLFIVSIVLTNVQDVLGADSWTGDIIYIDPATKRALNIGISLTFVFFEVIYLALFFNLSRDSFVNVNISAMVVIWVAIVTSFGINSLSALVYYDVPYGLSVLSRVFTNPILLPIETYILYIFIESSKHSKIYLSSSDDKW